MKKVNFLLFSLMALLFACTKSANLQPDALINVNMVNMGITQSFSSQATVYSQIWGQNGEDWDKARMPDFTDAGYLKGTVVPPYYAYSVDVTTLGAKGDGVTDNTAIFRKAIKQCAANGSVYVPAGTFVLSDTLMIKRSNICIRGAGSGTTHLLFKKGLEQLYPNYNITYPNQSVWSWSGGMITFSGNISGTGIQTLNIIFPDSTWAGHNFHERGYNGIGFSNGAHDGWVRSVTLTGCDVGLWIEASAHNVTVDQWTLNFGPNRNAQPISGHHGLNIYGGHNLLQNFHIYGEFQHDLSVESATSLYNVFRVGSGNDICIDHHNYDPRHNLFTNINAGLGSRLYVSGGNDYPHGVSYNETYWNITAANYMQYCSQVDYGSIHSSNNVAVGIKTTAPSSLGDAYGNWFETIDPASLSPQDLYVSQMKLVKNYIVN